MKKYNKDEIKNSLTIDQVFDLVTELGGEPIMNNGYFTAQTICHNHPGDGSHKLYYYDNTKLFRCYTACQDSFDIFELVCKVKKIAQEKKIRYDENGKEILVDWSLYDASHYVATFFGIEAENENFFEKRIELPDWDFLSKYEANNLEKQRQIIDLHIYDDKILKYLPRPPFEDWMNEGIGSDALAAANICYDPHFHAIVIPHYNINNQLIGIRERTLIKEQEQYGKYKPAILNGIMYNHPLGFNLYNINNAKKNIEKYQKAIIFEGEKSTLKYISYFGTDNDISLAICGNNISTYQINMLLSLGVKEIIIALDKQYQTDSGQDWANWTKKFLQIFNKYGGFVKFSFIVDRKNILDYKDSPIDKGKEIFLQLFQEREFL